MDKYQPEEYGQAVLFEILEACWQFWGAGQTFPGIQIKLGQWVRGGADPEIGRGHI